MSSPRRQSPTSATVTARSPLHWQSGACSYSSHAQTGPGGGDRYAETTWRAEPVFSLFGPGTVAAVGPRAGLLGEWLVTLSARPNYLGRYAPFGHVVQNLQGVAAYVLPIDRVVSVRVYEGNGREPLPPLE